MTELETQAARDGKDVNVWVEIGRLQGAMRASEDRADRTDEANEVRFAKTEATMASMDAKLDLLNKKADIAAGRAEQRAEDTVKLNRQLSVAITLAGLLLTTISVFATVHFHFLGL